MRALGFLLVVSGWPIAVTALAILSAIPTQMAFLLTAVATQVAGLVLIARSHLPRASRLR